MEHTVDTQTMSALKALSDTNLKVSEARALLTTLQEEETGYLETRELKALERIQKVYDESALLIKQTEENYVEVNTLCSSVVELSAFVTGACQKFTGLKEAFDEKASEWEKSITEKEKQVAGLRTLAEADRVKIANETKAVERSKELVLQDQRKLADQRGALERAITRLKDNRI